MDTTELRVNTTDLMGGQLQRLQGMAVGMALVGLVLSGIGAVMDLPGFFQSYLYAYMFWFGVTTGSLALLLLHHVVGGGWGYILRRFLEAGTRLLFPVMLLFIPVLLGMHSLYEWTHADVVARDPVLRAKSAYLNIPFFIARWVIYFAIWMVLAHFLNRWGATQDERADLEVSNRLTHLGSAGLILYLLTITFAAVDWVMSLTPHWFSSIFGPLVAVSQALSTLALMLVLLNFLAGGDRGRHVVGAAATSGNGNAPILERVPSGYFRDLGNLMLAFVLLWAYMSFSQYLIQYSGNIVEEVPWYTRRASGGWGWISLALIPLHFALPFLVLLVGSHIKRNPWRLARVAAFILVMRFIDLFWWVAPTFREHFSLRVSDLGTPLLLGGIWLWLWAGQVRGRPVVPVHDPRLEEALAGEAGHV